MCKCFVTEICISNSTYHFGNIFQVRRMRDQIDRLLTRTLPCSKNLLSRLHKLMKKSKVQTICSTFRRNDSLKKKKNAIAKISTLIVATSFQNHVPLLAYKKLLQTRPASLMVCFIKRKTTSTNLISTERQQLKRAIQSARSKPYDEFPLLHETHLVFFFVARCRPSPLAPHSQSTIVRERSVHRNEKENVVETRAETNRKKEKKKRKASFIC